VSRIIVDVGECTTEVMVTRGRVIAFYKQIEVGGRAMTKMAAERLGLDPATVADLRQRRMSGVSGRDSAIDAKVERALFDAVRPLMNDLAQEVTLCLRYYSVTFRGSRPDGVIVVGQDAAEPNLAATLGDALHVPASVGRALDGFDLSRVGGVIDASTGGPQWGVCVGLTTRVREQTASKRDRTWKVRAAA
jgi:type IV pilus assembly protein PilM